VSDRPLFSFNTHKMVGSNTHRGYRCPIARLKFPSLVNCTPFIGQKMVINNPDFWQVCVNLIARLIYPPRISLFDQIFKKNIFKKNLPANILFVVKYSEHFRVKFLVFHLAVESPITFFFKFTIKYGH